MYMIIYIFHTLNYILYIGSRYMTILFIIVNNNTYIILTLRFNFRLNRIFQIFWNKKRFSTIFLDNI